MNEFFKEKRLALILTGIGAIGGLIYWRFVGCTTGTCPIQSVWYWSTLWGAAVGYLIGDFITDLAKKRRKKKEESK